MATNLDLDDNLIREAQALGCHKTKKAAVNAALDAYVRKQHLLKLVEMFGQLEWDDTYDIKEERRRSTKVNPFAEEEGYGHFD